MKKRVDRDETLPGAGRCKQHFTAYTQLHDAPRTRVHVCTKMRGAVCRWCVQRKRMAGRAIENKNQREGKNTLNCPAAKNTPTLDPDLLGPKYYCPPKGDLGPT
eukprot:scaffold68854_cov70-Phaeocystis_antarctica.AAC.1